MVTVNELLEELSYRYEEWFQMTNEPEKLMITILSNKLTEQIKLNEYLVRRLANAEKNTTSSINS